MTTRRRRRARRRRLAKLAQDDVKLADVVLQTEFLPLLDRLQRQAEVLVMNRMGAARNWSERLQLQADDMLAWVGAFDRADCVGRADVIVDHDQRVAAAQAG